MKRRVLICALAALLVIGMVSCSMEDYARLGDIMGKMGNNIYGIEPNMQAVTETVSKLDDSVADDGTVTLPKSTELVDSLAEIKNSTQKMEEIKKQLDAPAAEDEETAKKVQESLVSTMETIIEGTKVEAADLAKADEKVQSAYKSVTKALDDIKSNISENPTKADIATVAIVNDLAETVKSIAENPDKYKTDGEFDTSKVIDDANKALKAIDALKVTSKFTDGIIDVSSLVSSFFSSSSSKGVSASRDASEGGDDDSIDLWELLKTPVNNAVNKIVDLTKGADGKFSETKYKSLVLQLNAFRTAYETTAWLVSPAHSSSLDVFGELLKSKSISGIGSKLSTNDAFLYAISFLITECDRLWPSTFQDAFEEFVNGEFEDLTRLLDSLTAESINADRKNGLENRFVTAVNTVAVIAINSDFNLGSIEIDPSGAFDSLKELLGIDES